MENIAGQEMQLNFLMSHENVYNCRDVKYTLRIIRKIATELPNKAHDIDWIQNYIESFLILNSRFYEDLLMDIVKGAKNLQQLPKNFSLDSLILPYSDCLSLRYHKNKKHYRNKAAHGSNYLRVGIIEFENDILPKPLGYKQTQELENMTSISDFLKMWQADMSESSDNIDSIFVELVARLNEAANAINLKT